MHDMAIGAAATSAIAAAISASFAGATSIAAWVTIRGRRPRLRVETLRGRAVNGSLTPDPSGPVVSVRVANVRDFDVEVTNLWFEPARSLTDRLCRRSGKGSLVPPPSWYTAGAGQVPGTLKSRHTEQYIFQAALLMQGFEVGGSARYRAVVQIVGEEKFHAEWLSADRTAATNSNTKP